MDRLIDIIQVMNISSLMLRSLQEVSNPEYWDWNYLQRDAIIKYSQTMYEFQAQIRMN